MRELAIGLREVLCVYAGPGLRDGALDDDRVVFAVQSASERDAPLHQRLIALIV